MTVVVVRPYAFDDCRDDYNGGGHDHNGGLVDNDTDDDDEEEDRTDNKW